MSEFWLLSKLATLLYEEMRELTAGKPLILPVIHTLSPTPKRGADYPAGFCALIPHPQTIPNTYYPHGPRVGGQTRPQGVLDLIICQTELIIAKKFPRNADKSQKVMMHLAVEGAEGLVGRSHVFFSQNFCLVTNLVPL